LSINVLCLGIGDERHWAEQARPVWAESVYAQGVK
jgi:hypothetical protein